MLLLSRLCCKKRVLTGKCSICFLKINTSLCYIILLIAEYLQGEIHERVDDGSQGDYIETCLRFEQECTEDYYHTPLFENLVAWMSLTSPEKYVRSIEWWNGEEIEHKESPVEKYTIVEHANEETISIESRPWDISGNQYENTRKYDGENRIGYRSCCRDLDDITVFIF